MDALHGRDSCLLRQHYLSSYESGYHSTFNHHSVFWNPKTVQLTIQDFNSTAIGHPLMPGQSILLSVKLSYDLKGTRQLGSSYPLNYTDKAVAAAWTQTSFAGAESTSSESAFFTAYAKVLGDVDGDFKVDIIDAALLAYSFGSHPGGVNWNPQR